MKDYISTNEAILITEAKIKGTMHEILGAEYFLNKALNEAKLVPVYYFRGYAVLQAFVDNEFYKNNSNIQNMWFLDGYFRDDHSSIVQCRDMFKNHRLKSAFINLSNSKFILHQNSGVTHKLNSFSYVGADYPAETLNERIIDAEGNFELNRKFASLFTYKPVYEGTFGHEDLSDNIIINNDDVYISVKELSNLLNFDSIAYDLTGSQTTAKNIPEALKPPIKERNSVKSDEPTHHKTVNSMATLIATLLKLASYDKQDLDNPHGNINKEIIAKAEGLGLTLGKDFIAKWLKKADDVL